MGVEAHEGRILVGELVRVSLSELRALDRNPRRGNAEAIKRSLVANAQYRGLVVNRPTMQVLVGNHTLAAARELGWEDVTVQFVEVDAEHARRIALVDNRTSDLAGYDEAELAPLLSEFDDLVGPATTTCSSEGCWTSSRPRRRSKTTRCQRSRRT